MGRWGRIRSTPAINQNNIRKLTVNLIKEPFISRIKYSSIVLS